jgi:hypothetical protein
LNSGGLSPEDSVTYAMVPAILVPVAVLASLIPARRATPSESWPSGQDCF